MIGNYLWNYNLLKIQQVYIDNLFIKTNKNIWVLNWFLFFNILLQMSKFPMKIQYDLEKK
mgnify:CR=1